MGQLPSSLVEKKINYFSNCEKKEEANDDCQPCSSHLVRWDQNRTLWPWRHSPCLENKEGWVPSQEHHPRLWSMEVKASCFGGQDGCIVLMRGPFVVRFWPTTVCLVFHIFFLIQGADMDVCLPNYGHCNFISGKHACIFYDEVSKASGFHDSCSCTGE